MVMGLYAECVWIVCMKTWSKCEKRNVVLIDHTANSISPNEMNLCNSTLMNNDVSFHNEPVLACLNKADWDKPP